MPGADITGAEDEVVAGNELNALLLCKLGGIAIAAGLATVDSVCVFKGQVFRGIWHG